MRKSSTPDRPGCIQQRGVSLAQLVAGREQRLPGLVQLAAGIILAHTMHRLQARQDGFQAGLPGRVGSLQTEGGQPLLAGLHEHLAAQHLRQRLVERSLRQASRPGTGGV